MWASRARCSVYSDVRIFQDLQRFCAAVAAWARLSTCPDSRISGRICSESRQDAGSGLTAGPNRISARGPVINHGNAGNQTKGPASATISKESGGLPHGKPREAPRKLRKISRKFREFGWNFCQILGVATVGRGNSRTMVLECLLCTSIRVKWGVVWVWSLSIGKQPRRRVLMGA